MSNGYDIQQEWDLFSFQRGHGHFAHKFPLQCENVHREFSMERTPLLRNRGERREVRGERLNQIIYEWFPRLRVITKGGSPEHEAPAPLLSCVQATRVWVVHGRKFSGDITNRDTIESQEWTNNVLKSKTVGNPEVIGRRVNVEVRSERQQLPN